MCSQNSWAAVLRQINVSDLQFLTPDGWNQFLHVYIKKWIFYFLSPMLLQNFEANNWWKKEHLRKYLWKIIQIIQYYFLLILLLFLQNFKSSCTISLLISVTHIAAEHNPADGRQRKWREKIHYLLHFAGAQLRTTTELILMNKWARQHWPDG